MQEIAQGWSVGVLQKKASVMKHIPYLISNGESTSFWLDPWQLRGKPVEFFGHRPIYNLGIGRDIIKVKHFISNGK